MGGLYFTLDGQCVDTNVPTRASDERKQTKAPKYEPDPHHMMRAPTYDQMNQVIAEYLDPEYEASLEKDTTNDRGLSNLFSQIEN